MAKRKPGLEVFDGDGEVSVFERARIKAEAEARQEKDWADREKIAEQKRKREAVKEKREAKKAATKRKRERAKREVLVGCARFEIPRLTPYNDEFIVKIIGVSEQPFTEHELFAGETCKQIKFRTPGLDDPSDPWRLPVCREFDNPKFEAVSAHPLFRDDDPEEPDANNETQPYCFEIVFYCSAHRNIVDDRKARKDTGRSGKAKRRSKRGVVG